MSRPSNSWYEAICAQLRAAGGALAVEQIWQGMVATDFQHASAVPRATLAARIAELVQAKKIVRVGPATYQMQCIGETQQEARSHAALAAKLVPEAAS